MPMLNGRSRALLSAGSCPMLVVSCLAALASAWPAPAAVPQDGMGEDYFNYQVTDDDWTAVADWMQENEYDSRVYEDYGWRDSDFYDDDFYEDASNDFYEDPSEEYYETYDYYSADNWWE